MITGSVTNLYNKVRGMDEGCLKRGARFATAPLFVISSALDVLLSMCTIIPAVINKKAFDLTFKNLSSSKNILSTPLTCILKSIRPQTPIDYDAENGGRVSKYFDTKALNYLNSPNRLVQEFGSRGAHFLQLLACIVKRTIEAVICPFALLAVLFTRGNNEKVNNLACATLKCTGIINDIFYAVIKMLNPRMGTTTTTQLVGDY